MLKRTIKLIITPIIKPKKIKLSIPDDQHKSQKDDKNEEAGISLVKKVPKSIKNPKASKPSNVSSERISHGDQPVLPPGKVDTENGEEEKGLYKKEWEEEYFGVGWIARYNKDHFWCRYCDSVHNNGEPIPFARYARKSNAIRHNATKTHEDNKKTWQEKYNYPVNTIVNNEPVDNFCIKSQESATSSLPVVSDAPVVNNGVGEAATSQRSTFPAADVDKNQHLHRNYADDPSDATVIDNGFNDNSSHECLQQNAGKDSKKNVTVKAKKKLVDQPTDKKKVFKSRIPVKKITPADVERRRKKLAAELMYSAMIACKDRSFTYGEELLQFLKVLFIDSDIAASMSLDRKKIPAILEKVIAPFYKEKMTAILKQTKFTMCIDEYTDVAGHASICIVVRYPSDEKGEIKDTLWDLVPAYKGDENQAEANAKYITKAVLDTFRVVEIPLNNIIAFCSDTCPLMMGIKGGVAALLKEYIPNIKIIECECHLGNLITRDSVKVLPPQVMELICAMPKHMRKSAKKKHIWKVLQAKVNLPHLQILEHAITRWTVRYNLILRSVRRYEPLIIFFQREVEVNPTKKDSKEDEEEKCDDKEKKTPEWILEQLMDPLMYAYLTFAEAMLSRLDHANVSLQSEKPIVSDYKGTMADLYLNILNMYMDEGYINNTPINQINPEDATHFKPLNELYVGQNCHQFIISEEATFDLKDFLTVCQRFQIEICKKVKEKCNFDCYSYFFNRRNVFDENFHQVHPNLDRVFDAFPQLNVDRDIVNKEWHSLISHNFPKKVRDELNKTTRTDHFWFKLKEYRDQQTNDYPFRHLATFALYVLSLPNSNAACERVWSKYGREMSKERASLEFVTVRAELLSSQYVCDEGGILKFFPSIQLIDKYNATRVRARAKKRVPVLDKDADKTKFGKIDITKDREQNSLKGEMLYNRKYSDLYPIDHEEIDILVHADDLNLRNFDKTNLCNSGDLKELVVSPEVGQELENNAQQTQIFVVDEKVYFVSENNEIREIEDEVQLMDLNDDNVNNSGIVDITNIHLCTEDDIEQVPATLFDVIPDNSDATNSDSMFRMDVPCKAVSAHDFCIKIMDNGLVNDYNYYLKAHPRRLLGRYSTGKENHPLRDRRTDNVHNVMPPDYELRLFVSEYQTLNGSSWIDGEVIDAFGLINEQYWHDTIFLTAQHTYYLLVEPERAGDQWFMYHLEHNFTGKMLMPYKWRNHWCLFIADFTRGLTIHIDPYAQKSVQTNEYKASIKRAKIKKHEPIIHRAMSCHNNFLKYVYREKPGDLHLIKWTNAYCADKRFYQADGDSCGVIVMNLMDHVGRGVPFETEFDPDEYREYCMKLLINCSKNMERSCMYCYSGKEKVDEEYVCMYCDRFAHANCRPSTVSDDEEKTKIYTDFDCNICEPCKKYCVSKGMNIDGLTSEKSSQESNSSSDNHNATRNND